MLYLLFVRVYQKLHIYKQMYLQIIYFLVRTPTMRSMYKFCAIEYHSIFVMYFSSLYLIDMNSCCTYMYLCDKLNCSLKLQALHAVSISIFTMLVTFCDSFNSEIQASNN